jgi:hypothetical protein
MPCHGAVPQAMEKQLKADLLAEIVRDNGRLLVHDEDSHGAAASLALSHILAT